MAIVGHAEMSVTNDYLRLAGVDVKENTTDKLGYYLHDQFSRACPLIFFERKNRVSDSGEYRKTP